MSQTLRRSDSDIKSAVIDDGAVTLSGEVDSYPEKLMATKAAQRVHGVTAIA
ncbi:BON domain-containing protein [Pseudonocardia sp.]|jgi:osmotically-inducible protein OsmY|uniref:BON domain-containing protein n=1 Tax=Pseudonocardia sp. TaxID=60912 RepID=UPI0026034B76|nr:BON domain-containing protein [Pseudonocardia sp.]MCW2723066.1 hypothetical protein [Pseudonocardia sp.]